MMHFNALVPELLVVDFARSLDFYCRVLGFEVAYQRPEHRFAYLRFGEAQLMLEEDDGEASEWRVEPLEAPFGRGLNLSIRCADALALIARIEAAGVRLRRGAEERWYRQDEQAHGELNFLLQDPDGYLLRFHQSLGMRAFGGALPPGA
nr:VOC family protein [Pseudomonas tohonis]